MRNAYLAICYACNENCRFCPCSKKEKIDHPFTSYSVLLQKIDELINRGITDITVSGGEPTLHPHLADIISYMQNRGVTVTILSNGERFSDETFRVEFLKKVDHKNLKVITTMHSHIPSEHEKANCTPGSFYKTVSGLQSIIAAGVRVIIKHCITQANYRDLPLFLPFIKNTFRDTTEVQFCSIDYCGIPASEMEKQKLTFPDIRPYLEKTFDYYEQTKCSNPLYCINMPLCSCDPYYWKYLPKKINKMYENYSDPSLSTVVSGHNNVDISDDYCAICKVKEICAGTYVTAFQYFGSDMVHPLK